MDRYKAAWRGWRITCADIANLDKNINTNNIDRYPEAGEHDNNPLKYHL